MIDELYPDAGLLAVLHSIPDFRPWGVHQASKAQQSEVRLNLSVVGRVLQLTVGWMLWTSVVGQVTCIGKTCSCLWHCQAQLLCSLTLCPGKHLLQCEIAVC